MDQKEGSEIDPRAQWHNVIYRYRGLAIQCGYRYAMKYNVHMDEYIAEAQYHLCIWALWIVGKVREPDFMYEKSLIRFVFMRLSRYQKQSKHVCATDVLGPDWEERYAAYTGAVTTQDSIARLFNELVDNDNELAVLIMYAKGFEQLEIAKELRLNPSTVSKILTRIRTRLESN